MSVLNICPQLLWVPTGGELIVTLLIIVVLFGGKKIPELAKGLGKGIREFNEAKEGIKSEIESGLKKNDDVKGPANTNTTTTTTTNNV